MATFSEPQPSPEAVFTDDEAARWLDAYGVFVGALGAVRAPRVCAHVIDAIARSEAVATFSCVRHPQPLLCETCTEFHAVEDGPRGCDVPDCDAAIAYPSTCSLLVPSCVVSSVDTQPPTVAVLTGGIRFVGWFCAAHGGPDGHAWTWPVRVDVLGLAS